ncbi:MAG TPA: endopeptidase La [Solirubrobacterales bacterium]|nr:endopeptidase La [Solirubrobacterales bacterium]
MTYRLVPLDDAIVFPTVTATLPIDVGEDERVFLIPRRDGEFGRVGVIAEVVEHGRSRRGVPVATVVGLHRGIAGAATNMDDDGTLHVEVQEIHDGHPDDEHTLELSREYRAVVEEILELRGDDGRIATFLRSIEEPGALADTSGLAPDIPNEGKLRLLETIDVTERLEIAVGLQRERLAELQVRSKIRDDVESGAQKQQREYFLRKQMESIRKELGDDETDLIGEYETKIDEAGMPEDVETQAYKELRRLERQGEQSPESSMIRSYLDWLIAVPWSKRSEDKLDPNHTREVLDADHAGLEDVKKRITQFVAVRKLREERKDEIEGDSRANGTILTLVGPPGTGKTSIGESIARSLDREFVRISLGGLHDEAEIRGHRRTYIGALPGRIVRALRDAETMNPVILLDEIDKVGSDWRGDPSAALLEVLDPAQNHSFRDHYLDVEVDLSQVVFIATANLLDTIPAPLLDRMEIIAFDGYTTEEKLAIAKGYLVPRQLKRNGLKVEEISVEDDVLRAVISEYTREAGVRQLEREIGKLLRGAATKIASDDQVTAPIVLDIEAVREALGRQKVFQESVERTAIPGVSTGLAVTGTGGDILFIEATAMDGDKGLVLTGQLGDVMKESARIALSYVRSHREELGIPAEKFQREFHVHVPAGAIPKDGPSAGTAMTTALVSLLSGRPVKHTVGMTGEVTLQGRVLPIGGLKQKILAAHAAGLTDVILPERNRGDLDEVPEEVREQMTFHPVMSIDEVLGLALEPAEAGADVAQVS